MNKYISDFQEKESLELPLLIKSITKGITQKGAPYASVILQDKTGTIDGKIWDIKPEQEAAIAIGQVEKISCEVLKYNNSLQLRIHKIEPMNQNEIDLSEYVIASKVSKDDLKEAITSTIASIQNKNYQALINGLYEMAGEAFYEYPAASKNHHSFLGGLATHVVGMVKLANALCELYPQLNRDLLVSGVLAHDLGKMIELSGPITTEYTLEGKLTGHISILHGRLMQIADELNIGDSEEAILLRHCVLSHHGQLEYGSPVVPLVQEAEVLSFIDNLDARLNTLESALESITPGEFTQRIFAMENRAFYKPKND
ncbi:3'-5' exoribonuclease YhaM family protein [Anaerorhabdus furcosa]|uniref:3'-5' exoribonuclease n=1 Tax=Anaerorhabdus furcosa TaxID=118967 RepID=A0A1T4NBK0_9FIRM|nr:HD domain-containing protein [Anaerorhabdus furcosa]SJZ76475.1 3'-5' exoribonuclease [Anaerorhabdus furcosa]